MGWTAFKPFANSIAINGTTVASGAVQCPVSTGDGYNYVVSNSTSQPCFLAFGPNSAVVAVIPTGAGTSSANGIYLGGNTTKTFTFGAQSWFSVITPTGTTTVYITPGDGL